MRNYTSFKKVTPALLVLLFLIIAGCSRNPVTGKKDFMLLSKKQEIALGKQSDPSIVASYGLYPDPTLQKFIDTKGQEMAALSHQSDLTYEFKILDSPVVNAFALPGGYVYFTRGIMAHFSNEAEFAGVLGHEIGHITARHSAKAYSKSMLAQVGLIAGIVVSKDFRQYANAASQGLQLMMLKFGRDAESESDKLGVLYSTQVGYDSNEMANFFQTIKRLSENSGQSIPTFMSTHPDPADRYKKVQEMTKVAQSQFKKDRYKVERAPYLAMIDGMIYGEDPRQGYVEGGKFYHPELKFVYNIPQGWKTQNSPQQVQMAPSDGNALMTLSLGKGTTLQAARDAMVQENSLQVVDNRNTNVNGFNAIVTTMEQVNEQEPAKSLRILSYFIQYESMIYVISGMTYKNLYPTYRTKFEQTQKSFKKLTDQTKMNVQPNLLNIEPVKATGTLSVALKAYGVSSAKLDEHAILNGMQLTDRVTQGSKIKIVKKGNPAGR